MGLGCWYGRGFEVVRRDELDLRRFFFGRAEWEGREGGREGGQGIHATYFSQTQREDEVLLYTPSHLIRYYTEKNQGR